MKLNKIILIITSMFNVLCTSPQDESIIVCFSNGITGAEIATGTIEGAENISAFKSMVTKFGAKTELGRLLRNQNYKSDDGEYEVTYLQLLPRSLYNAFREWYEDCKKPFILTSVGSNFIRFGLIKETVPHELEFAYGACPVEDIIEELGRPAYYGPFVSKACELMGSDIWLVGFGLRLSKSNVHIMMYFGLDPAACPGRLVEGDSLSHLVVEAYGRLAGWQAAIADGLLVELVYRLKLIDEKLEGSPIRNYPIKYVAFQTVDDLSHHLFQIQVAEGQDVVSAQVLEYYADVIDSWLSDGGACLEYVRFRIKQDLEVIEVGKSMSFSLIFSDKLGENDDRCGSRLCIYLTKKESFRLASLSGFAASESSSSDTEASASSAEPAELPQLEATVLEYGAEPKCGFTSKPIKVLSIQETPTGHIDLEVFVEGKLGKMKFTSVTPRHLW